MITNDRSTWPTGDAIWSIAQAIAIAEGYNLANSNPFRLNNPGDISDGYKTYGGEQHSGSNVTCFPNAGVGWQWLYDKLNNISQGKSHIYSATDTWLQLAKKWAGDWKNWVTNVTRDLGVDQSSTVEQYIQSWKN